MKVSLGFSYILTFTGSIISMVSGVFLALIIFIVGLDPESEKALNFLKPIEINPYAALAVIALSFIVIIFCYYGRGKGFYGIGVLAVVFSIIILAIRGGFYIGPLFSIVGGFLVYKNEKVVNSRKEEILEEEIIGKI